MITKDDILQFIADGMERGETEQQTVNRLMHYIHQQGWKQYEKGNRATYPQDYGKYLVRRKDGKIHWETWNNTSWAYNSNAITHWMVIPHPDG